MKTLCFLLTSWNALFFFWGGRAQAFITTFDKSYRVETVLVPRGDGKEHREKLSYKTHLRRLSGREVLTKNGVELTIGFFSRFFEHGGDTVNGDYSLEKSAATSGTITWNLSSNSRFQPLILLGLKKVSYDEKTDETITQGSRSLINMGAGVRYYLGKNYNLMARLNIEQEHFIDFSSSSTEKVAMLKGYLGVEGPFFTHGKWSGEFFAGVFYSNGKNTADFKVDAGFGYTMAVALKKWISGRSWYRLGAFLEHESQSVVGTGFSGETTHTSKGFKVGLGTSF